MADNLFNYSTDAPDLEEFIRELDLFDENVNKALRTAMHESGNMICLAQRRLVKSQRLAAAISTSDVYTTKDGALAITSGYQSSAFKSDSDGFNPGLVGKITEFGRPGKSAQHSAKTMKQVRKRIPNKQTASRKDWQPAVPTEVEIEKGTIQPYPHIRRGFDAVKDRAAQVLIDAYNAEIDKLGGGNQ
jgi:hypothetical protein